MFLKTNAKFEPGSNSVKRNFYVPIWTISLLTDIMKVKKPVRSRRNLPKQRKSSEIDNETHMYIFVRRPTWHNTLKSTKSSSASGKRPLLSTFINDSLS